MKAMRDFANVIDGKLVMGRATLPVDNPATGQVIAQAPAAAPADLDEAFTAAANAQPEWEADSPGRSQAMLAAADVITSITEEIAELITLEQGKPLGEARMEPLGMALALRHFAGRRLEPVVLSPADPEVIVRHRPVGVVAAITPWNSPILVAGMKLGAAWAVGNTVVLKPSPFTPLSTLRMAEALNDVMPHGVLNVVSGGNELGALMTAHPVPRLITFTGSPQTGKLVAESAGRDLKRTILELGGNDPALILEDASADEIAQAVFWAAFGNCGQTCVAVKRVYVPKNLHAEVVDAFTALAEDAEVGDGMDPATKIGPLTTVAQRSIVSNLVEDAKAHGARVTAGGHEIDGPGYFYRPAIVDGVTDSTRLVAEEQFGPALPVVEYTDLDDVIRNLNESKYGLGGSVWSPDTERAQTIADRLHSGTTWVNCHRASLWPLQPTAGTGWSGLGSEMGEWGMEAFTELQVRHTVAKVRASAVGISTVPAADQPSPGAAESHRA
jgi:acyl-CoA reductase-like NAD-dependent aldehyde dehydrogenase